MQYNSIFIVLNNIHHYNILNERTFNFKYTVFMVFYEIYGDFFTEIVLKKLFQ